MVQKVLKDRVKFYPAYWVGLIAFVSAGLLFLFDIRLAAVPLALFLALCIISPFFPGFGFFLPIVSHGRTDKMAVAVTFDDGPYALTTPELLSLLSKHNIKATFFVVGKKAAQRPELIKQIIAEGHCIGNHSFSHDNFVMLKSSKTLFREVSSTQDTLKGLGILPLAFRPPVGITNPRLKKVLIKLDMYNVNFSCRAMDCGNRRITGLSSRILKRVRPGDIIVLHDKPPKKEGLTFWLNEIETIFSGLKTKGYTVLPLPELIGKPVMIKTEGSR
ncbi:Polysaccharide deacetylase [uncultured Desulfobacterium sp.]|uniref:Polysaccharide deacetylase n=1 Tax=uncultured Desulfobacterium sp. TaxID=201089 RepID=A0A445MVM9_9BACT|nr:Polysaccharide deacetylase [uncultured Desulfobacterium sp.]